MNIDLVEAAQSAATFVFWLVLLLLMIGALLFLAGCLLVALVAGVRAGITTWRGQRVELPELPE